MKRTMAFALTAAMLATMFTGCGSTGTVSSTQTKETTAAASGDKSTAGTESTAGKTESKDYSKQDAYTCLYRTAGYSQDR